MKRHTVTTIRVVFLLICGAVLAITMGTYTPESESVQAYKQFAILEKARLESIQLDTQNLKKSELAIQGTDFTISNKQIDCYVEELVTLNGYDKEAAIDHALTATIEQYSLFYKACAEGYMIPDDELDSVIQTNINYMKQSSTPDEVDAFLTAINMTVEEYWESMRNSLKITETIGRYKQAVQKECSPTDANPTAFEDAWKTITQEAIDAQNIELFYQGN